MRPDQDRLAALTWYGNTAVATLTIMSGYTNYLHDMQGVIGGGSGDPRAVVGVIGYLAVTVWVALIAAVLFLERGKGYPAMRRIGYAVFTTALGPALSMLMNWFLHHGAAI